MNKKQKKLRVVVVIVLIFTVLILWIQLMRTKQQNYVLVEQIEEVRQTLSQTNEGASYEELELIVDSTYGIQSIQKHLKDQASFAFVLGRESCHYCQIYKEETLAHYSANEVGVTLLEIDTDYAFLFEEDLDTFIETLGLDYVGTPTTVFVKDGIVVEEYVGILSLDELIEKLEGLK